MEDLGVLRLRLDELDDRIVGLLGARFEVCREIAAIKRTHGLAMMQPDRVTEVRSRYLRRGSEVGLPPGFANDLFELLIAATCAMEDELMSAAGAQDITSAPGSSAASGPGASGSGAASGCEAQP